MNATNDLTYIQRIALLEQERQELLNCGDGSGYTFHDAARIGRLASIRDALESLWCQERQHRATRAASR